MKKFQLMRCKATTKKGKPCPHSADASGYCRAHNPGRDREYSPRKAACTYCGVSLFAVPNASKLRKVGRCEEHLHPKYAEPINCKYCGKPISDNGLFTCVDCMVDEAIEKYGKQQPKQQIRFDKEKYEKYLRSPAWQEKVIACKGRYNHRCAICNSKYKLRTHHRTYERLYNERLEDLICLCNDCHKKFHGLAKEAGMQ